MQLTSRRLALVFALAAPACRFSPAYDSDPEAWSPASSPLPDGAASVDAADGTSALDPACFLGAPAHDEPLEVSSRDTLSHLPGTPCLEGCHEAGGSAKTVLAVGGTLYVSQTSRVVAQSGSVPGGDFVDGVGGTRLFVDLCGNVFATASALEAPLQATTPFIPSPRYRRMDRTLRGVDNPGSCNQSGCHDFSSRLRWGVYF